MLAVQAEFRGRSMNEAGQIQEGRTGSGPWGLWVAAVLAWPVVGAVFILMHLASPLRATTPGARHLLISFLPWAGWALIVPLIIMAINRFPLDEGRWRRYLIHHITILLALVVVHTILVRSGYYLLQGQLFSPDMTTTQFLARRAALTVYDVIVYCSTMAGVSAWIYSIRARTRELETAQLREHLVAAEVALIKNSLPPHLLLGTLDDLAAVIRDERESAEELIDRYAVFLRNSLVRMRSGERDGGSDIELLQSLFELEAVRAGRRLQVVPPLRGAASMAVPYPELLVERLAGRTALWRGVWKIRFLEPEGEVLPIEFSFLAGSDAARDALEHLITQCDALGIRRDGEKLLMLIPLEAGARAAASGTIDAPHVTRLTLAGRSS
jgi:hypothetical protein